MKDYVEKFLLLLGTFWELKCPDYKADSLKNLKRLWKLSKNHASMKQCMEIGEPTH